SKAAGNIAYQAVAADTSAKAIGIGEHRAADIDRGAAIIGQQEHLSADTTAAGRAEICGAAADAVGHQGQRLADVDGRTGAGDDLGIAAGRVAAVDPIAW